MRGKTGRFWPGLYEDSGSCQSPVNSICNFIKNADTNIYFMGRLYVLSVTFFIRVKQWNQIPSQTNIIKWYRGELVQRKSYYFNTNFRRTQHKRLSTQVRSRINMKSRRHIWFLKSIFKSAMPPLLTMSMLAKTSNLSDRNTLLGNRLVRTKLLNKHKLFGSGITFIDEL
jgi:hypothetical protein